jgi:hypothetical protein
MFTMSQKLPWALAALCSIVYFWLFTQVSKGNLRSFDSGLLGGFCVWGEPNYPEPPQGCTTSMNSHMYAWYEDAFMTILVVAAFFKNDRKEWILHLAIGGIIFLHGILHFFLSTALHCLTTDVSPVWNDLGWIAYLVFSFLLSLVIFGMGFASQVGFLWVLVASVVTTLLTYQLAHGAGADWVLSALFATSHPIASITGLLTESLRFSKFMGWAFLLSTIDGIVELMWCKSFLKPHGGHIWYDLFLHVAVLASLPIFNAASRGYSTLPEAPSSSTGD